MKWAFFGSSLVSAYWNGAATYYRGIIRALAGSGHQVTFYEPDAYGRQQHRDIEDPSWARVRVYAPNEKAMHEMLRDARDSDVLVKASGVGVLDEELEAAVLEYRRAGMRAVFWDVDAPATLDRLEKNSSDPFRRLVPQYDLVFTYGGGPPVIRRYEALGARRCVPVYNALDPSTHFRVQPESRFEGLLGFLGNRLPDREKRVEAFFIHAAAKLPRERFLIGGSGWEDKAFPSNVKYLGHVFTHEHNALNSSLRAVLNLSRESMADCGYSPATRVFEAAGAAACVVTDAWEGIGLFLEPDSEVLVVRDGDDLARQLADLSPERARRIGDAAARRIKSSHTYRHRVRLIEEALR